MEIHQLTCPQLLSEEILRGILKERCIGIQDFEKMDKIKLVELFKRVVLPLPQRKYSDRKLGQRMQRLRAKRNVKVADYNENDFSMTVTESSRASEETHSNHNDRLSSLDDAKLITKRIRSSSSGESDNAEQKEIKRKNEVPLKTNSKKRQKITWP